MDAATPSRVAGLDWASRLHAVCVLDPDGQVRARFDVPHTGSELRGLTRRLVRLGVGKVAIQEAMKRAGVEGGRVSEVIMGQILTAGQGQNPARQASMARSSRRC